MSSVINNSNLNSALINTLNASASLVNPQVYQTKPIYNAHSITYSANDPSNGSLPVRSNSTVFQLNKYGIISQILLTYKKTYTNGTGGSLNLGVPQNDFFNCVEKVELLSSSRVISTLTKIDFMAQFSNLPTNKLTVIQNNLLKQTAPLVAVAAGATSGEFTFTAPLIFGFMTDINTQLNASFLEPLSVRITWGKDWNQAQGFATGVVGNLVSPQLSVRYKNYQEDANAKIIAENFSSPTLNMLSSRFYDENRVSIVSTTGVATPDASIEVELKNTECVQDFYIVLISSNPNALAGATSTSPSDILDPKPQEIKTLTFTGSGQEIVSLNASQLAYGKIDMDGFSVGQDFVSNLNGLTNVVKFQTGIYNENVLSNTISLREINNPRIKITFDIPAATELRRYYCYVVEDSSAIYSVTSATGALQISLSN